MPQNRLLTRIWQTRAVRQTRHLASPVLWYRHLTAERRRLPDFVIAGAQKAGTTSLFGYLSKHPACAPSLTKEVHYFDKHFDRGQSWYRMHFPVFGAADRATCVEPAETRCYESSPYYMFDPRVPQRMRQTLPDAKIIFLLRNPVSRAYSHYQHSVRRGREPLSFELAIEAEPARLAGQHERLVAEADYQSAAHRNYSYLARGLYAEQLERWQEHYPADQLLVVESERLFQQPGETFREVLDFLGLIPWTPAAFATQNSGRYNTPMASETRDRLAQYFAPHNERLFQLLGRRFAWQ